MLHDPTRYQTPLVVRYGRDFMIKHWSDNNKYVTWRKLWLALAKGQQACGALLKGQLITDKQISELETNLENIDYDRVREIERETRHEPMAHIRAYGEVCPNAAPIIHWGATSCYVTDNTYLILIREALKYTEEELAKVIYRLTRFAESTKALPTLGYTHFKPAQPVTVGKRACLWIKDLLIDLRNLRQIQRELPFLGVKGTTGTQASFLKIFNGDYKKVEELDRYVARQFGFEEMLEVVSGQTYSRKIDVEVLSRMESFGTTVHKLGLDLRMLQHENELEEPKTQGQIYSSAMPHKINPRFAELICALSRHLVGLKLSATITAMTQILERSLDDSAIQRIYVPESFLAADGVLNVLQFVTDSIIINPVIVLENLRKVLPFMATEDMLMVMTAQGVDRQVCHGWLQEHSQAAGDMIKKHGKENDLLDRIRADERFKPIHDSLDDILNPAAFIGCSVPQVERFLSETVMPELERYPEKETLTVALEV